MYQYLSGQLCYCFCACTAVVGNCFVAADVACTADQFLLLLLLLSAFFIPRVCHQLLLAVALIARQ